MEWLETGLWACKVLALWTAVVLVLWLVLFAPAADRLADRDVEGWGRGDE